MLSETEKLDILRSEDFGLFIDFSSKIIERALNDTYDFTIDYRKEPETKRKDTKSNTLICTFYNDRWCGNRSVTR